MTRIGFPYRDNVEDAGSVDAIEAVCALPGLYPEGLFTHLSCADEEGDAEVYTRIQYDLFLDIAERLGRRKVCFELRHCSNSAATVHYPEMHLDLVRPGILFYGMMPSPELSDPLSLHPAMEMKSGDLPDQRGAGGRARQLWPHLCDAARYAAGDRAGRVCGRIPARLVWQCGKLLLRGGARVPVVGRICMDQCMLDVSAVPDALEGAYRNRIRRGNHRG